MSVHLIRITTVPISLDKLLGNQLSFMNQHFSVTAISADQNELEKIAAKYGVSNYHVELTRAITPVQDLKALWELYRFLKKEKPEIVHTHTPKAGLIGMMAAWMAGVPVKMHTVAGMPLMEATGLKRKILNFTEKLTYFFADKVYPNSFVMKDIIIKENFCPAEKLQVIGNGSTNGIDLAYFKPEHLTGEERLALRRELGISPDDFVFVFVGRLVGDKGINELVTAFKQISKSANQQISRNCKLLLVGPLESELDPLLPETVQEIESNPDIITTGFQKDVRPYLAISDVLTFPSYREGFPNVVMQAGAMGLPAIVTDINGCNEIVVEGENGTIIPPKNTKALQDAMMKMHADTEWRVQLQQKARPMIASRYDQQLVWDALLNEYQTLLRQKGIGTR